MASRSTSGTVPIYQPSQITGNVPDPSTSLRRGRSGSNITTYTTNTPQNHRVPLPSYRPSLADIGRRDSNQTYQSAGTSTPSRRRRPPTTGGSGAGKVNGNGNGVNGKEDWASLEPDEVFRRLPVNEVKRVEAKMRDEALNKQSELRSMVGTRYRDLLTSATQITTLHSSSLRLSDSLRTIARTCSKPTLSSSSADNTLNITVDPESIDVQEGDVIQLLPVAAHMKLLLDAPEALYAYLSRHAFLDAAFLWLMARVVREGLTNMPEETSGPYIPLLQKQWETLLPFRGQIVHRATASLRSRDKLDPKTLSKTLLSIILLDNLPLPDALALLLNQRTKALRDILSHPHFAEGSTSKTHGRARRNSRIVNANASREAAHERETITRVLIEAVEGLLETVSAAQTIFDKRRKTMLDGESLLEEAIRLVQKGEAAPTLQSVSLTKQISSSSHQRRASRLASISLPMPKTSPGANKPPVSAIGILQNLPSSQILLRYLPTSISAWTPFITPSPPPTLNEKLRSWQKSAIDLLSEAVPHWLEGLKNVSDIWQVRSELTKILSQRQGDGEFENAIKNALEDEWNDRVKEVWKNRLDLLVHEAEARIREAGEKIRSGGDHNDIIPETFLFSDLAFPSAPNITLSATPNINNSFNSFLSQLKKRTTYRTPLLDEVLTDLESAAADIKGDMKGLPSSLYTHYSQSAQSALVELVKVLERVLESMGSSRGDGSEGIEADLFLGRVALFLAKGSTFLNDIAGSEDLNTGEIEAALLRVHSSSTARWTDRSVKEALALLAPLFDAHRGSFEIRAAWQESYPTTPSAAISESLQSLVAATRQLGLPPHSTDLPIIPDLVKAFVSQAKGLEGWKSQETQEEDDVPQAQAALDLGFLVWLAGEDAETDEIVQRFLSKTDVLKDYPLQTLIEEHVRRTQLLLHPLTSHLPTFTSTSEKPTGYGDHSQRQSSLLRFGQPTAIKTGVGSEFRSPIPVAKPGKRMGLLSIPT